MIIDTLTVRDGKRVFKCDQCGNNFATSHAIDKCRCFCVSGAFVRRDRGLGDVIAKMISGLGIRKKPGCRCNQRQAWLNRVWFALIERLR